MSSTGGERRLLVRDLAQVASPAGTAAPLRGGALGEVDVVEHAYVLCAGESIEAVGRMRDLRPLAGEIEEIDGRGLCAIPGLVDCHTHACFAGDRVEEFAQRAAGASYEELHAAGGGIMSTVRATRAAGEHALAAAAQIAEAADVFLERGAFDATQARRYLSACAAAGLAVRLHGDQFTEQGAVPLAIELRARSIDHLEATGDEGVAALGRSEVAAVLLPASALFLARPMPPARALVD